MNLENGEDFLKTDDNQKFDVKNFLKLSIAQGISDIHLRTYSSPIVRKDGVILRSKLPALNTIDMLQVIRDIVPPHIQEKVGKSYDLDFSIEIQGLSRFRVNLLHDQGNIGFVLRTVPIHIPTLENLRLPPILKTFPSFQNGLILATGPTGSGKSTTLASILDYLNQTLQKHIITLEDPIEFIHINKKSMFTQRQIGIDIDTFPNGVKYALRQDPDVILIGEMRDRETISSALKAAETGHLVFSTLHTNDAVQTINRIINAFEPHEREPIRLQIAAALRGTISQKLVKRADGKGRVPATEVLVVTPATKDYIARDEVDKIYDLIKTGDYSGMMSMNISLYKLVKAGLISEEAALQTSDTPSEMQQILKGVFHGTS